MMIWRDIERSSRLRVLQPDFNPSKRSLLPCPFFLDMLAAINGPLQWIPAVMDRTTPKDNMVKGGSGFMQFSPANKLGKPT